MPTSAFVLRRPFWLLVAMLGVAACSGPRPAAEPPRPSRPPEVPLDRYEDFDMAPYEDEALTEPAEVDHDVPAELMQGRAGSEGGAAEGGEGRTGGVRTARGYRVQLLLTQDRAAALRQEQEALAWWQGLAPGQRPTELFPRGPAVYVVYRQPYYRVRMGNFATRAEAQRALNLLRSRFPAATIAPDTVVLTDD